MRLYDGGCAGELTGDDDAAESCLFCGVPNGDTKNQKISKKDNRLFLFCFFNILSVIQLISSCIFKVTILNLNYMHSQLLSRFSYFGNMLDLPEHYYPRLFVSVQYF